MDSNQATLEEDVTLLNGHTSSRLTGRTTGLPRLQLPTFLGDVVISGIKLVSSAFFLAFVSSLFLEFPFRSISQSEASWPRALLFCRL
jgi:hypothetical protein